MRTVKFTTAPVLHAIAPEGWFLLVGFALVPLIHVRGASHLAHAGFLAAMTALVAVGLWIRRFVLRIDEETPAPAHAIVIGQTALIVWFYVRSGVSHALGLPGVSGAELYLLALAAAAHLWFRRKPAGTTSPAYLLVWLGFWASTLTFLGYRSGRLDLPSSDPDLHALWARLTAEHGWLVYDLLPQNAAPFSYPSGFSALNAIWIDLSRLSAVTVVNCQIALQACLMVGLILELVFALRRGAAPGVTLPLIALAHFLFSFPVNATAAYFEGTARLAHTAMAILPLTFTARLASGRERGLAPVLLVSGVCLGWAVVINPAQVFAAAPCLAGAALLLSFTSNVEERRGVAPAVGIAAAIVALFWLSDSWLGPLLHATSAGMPRPPLHVREAFAAGFAAATGSAFLGVVPFTCSPGPYCQPASGGLGWILALPSMAVAIGALFVRRRWPAAAALVPAARVALCTGAALWLSNFIGPFVTALISEAPGREGALLRGYTQAGLTAATAFLFFALIACALALLAEVAERLRVPGAGLAAPVAVALACGALAATRAGMARQVRDAYVHHVRGAPESAMGILRPEDVRVARTAAGLVKPGESVLLPGLVKQMSEWESWYFTLGGGRAIPLYTDVPFPFFHTGSPYGPAPVEYREHVCERLDLPWLASRGILWLFESEEASGSSCVRGWPAARGKYYQLVARDGGTSLWRMRTGLLREARSDPALAP